MSLSTGGVGYFCKKNINIQNVTEKYTEYPFDNETQLLKLKLPTNDTILIIVYYYSVTYHENSMANMIHMFQHIDEITLACGCNHTLFAGDREGIINKITNITAKNKIINARQIIKEKKT